MARRAIRSRAPSACGYFRSRLSSKPSAKITSLSVVVVKLMSVELPGSDSGCEIDALWILADVADLDARRPSGTTAEVVEQWNRSRTEQQQTKSAVLPSASVAHLRA